MNTDQELFKGTTFSDLMKDIYHNAKKKSRRIDSLIKKLEPLIQTNGDAMIIVPLIKEYLDVSVKNDDSLVKLAGVVQRLISANSKTSEEEGFGLSDEERKQLLESAEEEIEKVKKENAKHVDDKVLNRPSSRDRRSDSISEDN